MLENVLHVPDLHFNLLSTHRLCADMNCDIIFSHDKCLLQEHSQTGSLVLGKLDDGLYAVDTSTSQPSVNVAIHEEAKLWHLRLGHLPLNKLHYVNPMFCTTKP